MHTMAIDANAALTCVSVDICSRNRTTLIFYATSTILTIKKKEAVLKGEGDMALQEQSQALNLIGQMNTFYKLYFRRGCFSQLVILLFS